MKKDKRKYDFSTPESQKLLSEFTKLLNRIYKDVEERERYIVFLEKKLAEKSPIKTFFNKIIKGIMRFVYKILKKIGLIKFVKNLVEKNSKLKSKVDNILKG